MTFQAVGIGPVIGLILTGKRRASSGKRAGGQNRRDGESFEDACHGVNPFVALIPTEWSVAHLPNDR